MEDIVGDKNYKSVIMKSPEKSPVKQKSKSIRKGDSQRSIGDVEPSPRGMSQATPLSKGGNGMSSSQGEVTFL
jgi:hypothetical protein